MPFYKAYSKHVQPGLNDTNLSIASDFFCPPVIEAGLVASRHFIAVSVSFANSRASVAFKIRASRMLAIGYAPEITPGIKS